MKRGFRKEKNSNVMIMADFEGTVDSVTKNISQSGILCQTSRKVDEMTLLDVKFELPKVERYRKESVWIECSGVVVRCKKMKKPRENLDYEVSIFFSDMSEKNKKLLAHYIRRP